MKKTTIRIIIIVIFVTIIMILGRAFTIVIEDNLMSYRIVWPVSALIFGSVIEGFFLYLAHIIREKSRILANVLIIHITFVYVVNLVLSFLNPILGIVK